MLSRWIKRDGHKLQRVSIADEVAKRRYRRWAPAFVSGAVAAGGSFGALAWIAPQAKAYFAGSQKVVAAAQASATVLREQKVLAAVKAQVSAEEAQVSALSSQAQSAAGASTTPTITLPSIPSIQVPSIPIPSTHATTGASIMP